LPGTMKIARGQTMIGPSDVKDRSKHRLLADDPDWRMLLPHGVDLTHFLLATVLSQGLEWVWG